MITTFQNLVIISKCNLLKKLLNKLAVPIVITNMPNEENLCYKNDTLMACLFVSMYPINVITRLQVDFLFEIICMQHITL